MALVLRKAVMPKNVSLFKCIKGRNLATAANKQNPAVLTAACARLHVKQRCLPPESEYLVKKENAEKGEAAPRRRSQTRSVALRCSLSCPTLDLRPRTLVYAPLRHRSPPSRPFAHPASAFLPSTCLVRSFSTFKKASCKKNTKGKSPREPTDKNPQRDMSGVCPCPGSCPDACNQLPPPCNCPPKCIQYMTGYYYYPYGFWFCGPYHVGGLCCAVQCCGPCSPCPCPPPKNPCPPPCCVCPSIPGAAASGPIPGMPKSATPSSGDKPKPVCSTSKVSPVASRVACATECEKKPEMETSQPPSATISKVLPFSVSVTPKVSEHPKVVPVAPQKNAASGDLLYSEDGFYTSIVAKPPARNYYSPSPEKKPSYTYVFNPALPKANAESSPSFTPRQILSVTERDYPHVPPDTFALTSVPRFKNPSPALADVEMKWSRKI